MEIQASGREATVVAIRWGEFTNEEIIKAFREWVKASRPSQFPGPSRQGHKPGDWRARLTRLGAMGCWIRSAAAARRLTPPGNPAASGIGLDITQRAITLIKKRLQGTYGRRMKFVSGSGGTGHWPVPSGNLPDGSEPASRQLERAGRPFHPEVFLVRLIGERDTPNEATSAGRSGS